MSINTHKVNYGVEKGFNNFLAFFGLILISKYFSINWELLYSVLINTEFTNLIFNTLKFSYVFFAIALFFKILKTTSLIFFSIFYGYLIFTGLVGNTHVWLIFLLTLFLLLKSSLVFNSVETDAMQIFILSLKLQLSIVYFFAALSKLQIHFISGSSLNFFYLLTSTSKLYEKYIPDNSVLFFYVSLFAIITELFLSIGFWFNKTKTFALFMGMALHFCILIFLSQDRQVFYELVTYTLLMYFLMNSYWFNPAGNKLLVIWDDSCSFCAKFIFFLRVIDINRTISFIGASEKNKYFDLNIKEDEVNSALQLVDSSSGKRYQGYDAISYALSFSPLTLFVFPILKFYPIKIIGKSIYKRVAFRRSCSI